MNICIIPARGGSKRIPRKNIKDFCGKPIIAYSIQAAKDSQCFDKIIVSTDDKEISKVAIKYGASVPYVRPKELSDDFATTFDVIRHCIKKLDLKDSCVICCLYPTAPFIKAKELRDAMNALVKKGSNFVFSATRYDHPIQRAIHINKLGFCEMFYPKYSQVRTQDLAEILHDAGQFYIGTSKAFTSFDSVLTSSLSFPYVLPRNKCVDIDEPEDWILAECIYKNNEQ